MSTRTKFKVGDYVICPKSHCRVITGGWTCGWSGPFMDALVGEVMSVDEITHSHRSVSCNGWVWMPSWLRKATEEEIRLGRMVKKAKVHKSVIGSLPPSIKCFTPKIHFINDTRHQVQAGMDEDRNGLWVQLHVYRQLEQKYEKLMQQHAESKS